MKRTYVVFMILSLAAAGALLSVLATGQQRTSQPQTILVADPKIVGYGIAADLGPSWLKHLGLTVARSHMGQMGGTAPAASSANLNSVMQRFLATFRSDPEKAAAILQETFPVTGADLYRWNCQGCHGPEGKGADPEINSVIGPVQGTSAKLTRDRMEARGIEADDDMVNQMSELAATSLRDRLLHGGKNMPAFAHLRPDETEALVGYLEKLAGVPPTKREGLVVQESASRVGEHIIRGTCHTCHDATGPGNGLTHADIPSLASIPGNHSLSGVIHQVQYGSSPLMKLTGADVMPSFQYLNNDEAAAAYFVAFSAQK